MVKRTIVVCLFACTGGAGIVCRDLKTNSNMIDSSSCVVCCFGTENFWATEIASNESLSNAIHVWYQIFTTIWCASVASAVIDFPCFQPSNTSSSPLIQIDNSHCLATNCYWWYADRCEAFNARLVNSPKHILHASNFMRRFSIGKCGNDIWTFFFREGGN